MYSKEYKNWVLVLLVAFFFMVMLDMSVVTIAIPKIMSELGVNLEDVDWIMIAYNVATAIIIIPITFVLKKIGLKIPIILSIIFFTISSIACGLSTSINMLIFFRVIQGLSGGGIAPLGLSLLGKVFEPHERGKAMGVWGVGAMVAPAIGPTIGGWITDNLSWRWIFFVNVPVAIITLIGIWIILENDRNEQHFKANFDFIGFVFFSMAVACILIVFNEGQNKGWSSSYIHAFEILAAAGFILYLLFEQFIRHPLIDFNIFKNYNFTLISSINAIRAISLFGSLFIIPVFLENIMNYTPFTTGLIMMPAAIMVSISAPLFGKGTDRFGPKYFIVFGMLMTGISLIMYWNLSRQSSLWDIIFPSILRGIGLGMMYSPIMSSGLNSVKREQIPEASGLLPITMRLSAGFGIALFANYLTTKQAYYLSRYAGKINNKNFLFRKMESIFNLSGQFRANKGIITNSARVNPGLGMINGLVKSFALIQAYDAVFILAGVICFLGVIPSLLLKNKIRYDSENV